MKNNFLLFATSYPYTMGILAVIWIGSALLLIVDRTLSITPVIIGNAVATLIIAVIGFRK